MRCDLDAIHVRPRRPFPAARALAAFTLLVATGCGNDAVPTAVDPGELGPQQLISDAAHAGKPHFYFLPPMVSAPVYTGAFDPGLTPSVQICVLAGTGCGSVLTTFVPGTGSTNVRLDSTAEHYIVNWHTNNFDLDPAVTYRIRVIAAGVELGFADVDVVSSGRELKNVITNEFIPLLDGRTLPIKFRVEQGFLARIEVTPNPDTVVVTLTTQFGAVAYDLHGATLPATFTWTSSDQDVATVDGSGLATGVANGTATIAASAAGVTGTATLDVIGVTSIEVAPIEATAAPGATQQFMAILHYAGDYLNTGTEPTVTWSSSNSDVATVDQTGLATAVGEGEATISASAAGTIGTATLTVRGGIVHVIGTANYHSCAIAAGGAAYCWGYGGYGALGRGTFAQSLTPVPVAGGHQFTSITIGWETSCALDVAGAAWCWGYNQYGAVGNGGSATTFLTPQAVAGGHVFESIASGDLHVCGLTSGGEAWCWGYGGTGALGQGNLLSSTVPVRVPGHTFTSLSAGDYHTCGLISGGAAYCWGYNYYGGLGIGAATTTSPYGVLTPTAVIGGLTFASIHDSGFQTCALDAAGAAYCWGYNYNGQIGNGTRNLAPPYAVPTPTPVAGGLTFTSIAAGSYHTCGIEPDGDGYCWGYGGHGELGTGGLTDRLTPALIGGGHAWAALSAGVAYTCGVTTGGEGKCWGYNAYGTLGNGGTGQTNAPGPISGGLTFEVP